MKKIKLVTILLLSLMITLGMSSATFADSKTAKGGTYVYDGNTITDTVSNETIPNLEPGDDVTIDFTYKNDSDDTTYWYMKNDILHTLEEYGASNGGYTYTLTDNGEVVFSNEAIGGEKTPSGLSEGLKGVNDALKGDAEAWAAEHGFTVAY